MKIPGEKAARLQFFRETADTLARSMQARRTRYARLRQRYLYGLDDGAARYNKIYSQIGTLSGYLFAQNSVRFSVTPGPSVSGDGAPLYEASAERLRQLWNNAGADPVVSNQVRWSLVYGFAAVKMLWQNEQLQVFPVDPGALGVWREDLDSLDGQEAILHTLSMDEPSLRRLLELQGMAAGEIERRLTGAGEGSSEPATPGSGTPIIGMMQPIVFAPTAGSAGGVSGLGASMPADYAPSSGVRNFELQEMWLWDDADSDWRVVTLLDREHVIFDRKNPLLPAEHPFAAFVPETLGDYLWGFSLVDSLVPLQAWREKRMNQLDRLFQRQVNPPMVVSGFMGGITDEKASDLMKRGGAISSQTPGAKIELLTPQMPPAAFGEINEIDAMFSETVGLSGLMQGQTSAHVRNAAQVGAMMQAGSGRLVRRALAIEQTLVRIAKLLYLITRLYDKRPLLADDGQRAAPVQLGEDAQVGVALHSASPLFGAMIAEQATHMLETGIIDGESFLDLTQPPMTELLKQRLHKKEQQQQAMMQQIMSRLPPEAALQLLKGKGAHH